MQRKKFDDPPDWSFWKHLLSVRILDAVALSLNFDPEQFFSASGFGYEAGFGFYGPIGSRITPEFEKRLRITTNHAERGRLPTVDSHPNVVDSTVELAAFSKWAESLGWDIPNEFPRTTQEQSAEDTIPRKRGGRPPKWNWEQAICATMAEIWVGNLREENPSHEWNKFMIEWLSERGSADDGGPPESEVRKRISLITNALASSSLSGGK